jgi:DNA (cytosine-5)-methyltransferase 1
MSALVLSLFPGIGLLDRAFEEEGFCVVRGPDLLWGGDVRRFSPPAGRFDGVIGGPPCPAHSDLGRLARAAGMETEEDFIPEYERVVKDAQPDWFVMEQVKGAPEARVPGYVVRSRLLDNRWINAGDGIGPEQRRLRRFSFGTRDGHALIVDLAILNNPVVRPTATAQGTTWRNGKAWGDRSAKRLAEMIRDQGLPADFLDEAPFTLAGKCKVVGNGVPLPMGRAVAQAVRAAMYPNALSA